MYAVLIPSDSAMRTLEWALEARAEKLTELVQTARAAAKPAFIAELQEVAGLRLQIALAKAHHGGAAVVPF
jgi:hypothetical protein